MAKKQSSASGYFEITKSLGNGTCNVIRISSSNRKTPFEPIVCERCFKPQRIGVIFDGMCINCGNRFSTSDFLEMENSVDEFLDTLAISDSTKVNYRNMILSKRGTIYNKYAAWIKLSENDEPEIPKPEVAKPKTKTPKAKLDSEDSPYMTNINAFLNTMKLSDASRKCYFSLIRNHKGVIAEKYQTWLANSNLAK